MKDRMDGTDFNLPHIQTDVQFYLRYILVITYQTILTVLAKMNPKFSEQNKE